MIDNNLVQTAVNTFVKTVTEEEKNKENSSTSNSSTINSVDKQTDTKGEIKMGGWYYDIQKENILTSIRLYANTYKDDQGVWQDHKNYEYLTQLTPCTSILTSDFSISTSNNWSDLGSDPVGDLINGVKQNVAPYSEVFKKGMEKMRKSQENIDEIASKSFIAGKLIKAVDKIDKFSTNLDSILKSGGISSGVSELLNKSFLTQGTRFTYYSGSGVGFSNLSMQFTLFPKFEENKFITVNEQLDFLYPYFIGHLEGAGKLAKAAINSVKEGFIEESKEDVSKYFKMWSAPGNYRTLPEDIDVKRQPGTFELQIGAFYTISNLVVSDVNFNFSKQMVKNPLSKSEKDLLSPLYCDVSIALKPSTKYSDEAIKEFVSGTYSGELAKKLMKSLDAIRGTTEKLYS